MGSREANMPGNKEDVTASPTVGDVIAERKTEFNFWIRWFVAEGLGPTKLQGWHGSDDFEKRVDWLLDQDNWQTQRDALVGILLDAGDKREQKWANRQRGYGASGGPGVLGLRQMLMRVRYAAELQGAIEQEGGYGTEYVQERVDGWREEQRLVVEDLAWAILADRAPKILNANVIPGCLNYSGFPNEEGPQREDVMESNKWKELALRFHGGDDDPCHYDHDDYCQTHDQSLPCPYGTVRELLQQETQTDEITKEDRDLALKVLGLIKPNHEDRDPFLWDLALLVSYVRVGKPIKIEIGEPGLA